MSHQTRHPAPLHRPHALRLPINPLGVLIAIGRARFVVAAAENASHENVFCERKSYHNRIAE